MAEDSVRGLADTVAVAVKAVVVREAAREAARAVAGSAEDAERGRVDTEEPKEGERVMAEAEVRARATMPWRGREKRSRAAARADQEPPSRRPTTTARTTAVPPL